MVTCCMKQLTLFYYCACFCETCSSALIGARGHLSGGQVEIVPYFYPCTGYSVLLTLISSVIV